MGVVHRAHPVCGEPRIQRNASGEVAAQTNNKPKFFGTFLIFLLFLQQQWLNKRTIYMLHSTS